MKVTNQSHESVEPVLLELTVTLSSPSTCRQYGERQASRSMKVPIFSKFNTVPRITFAVKISNRSGTCLSFLACCPWTLAQEVLSGSLDLKSVGGTIEGIEAIRRSNKC